MCRNEGFNIFIHKISDIINKIQYKNCKFNLKFSKIHILVQSTRVRACIQVCKNV